ncbi:putative transcription factor/ chromatin remodeling BED-type(Zn) family [Helianthus annuus]|nr:putative transcription factor/ chromatin remodeling BED-type(Zn) family [Helianthus annuus]
MEALPTMRNKVIWAHLELCKMSSDSNRAQCVHCGVVLKLGSHSTLKKTSRFVLQGVQNAPDQGQTTMSTDMIGVQHYFGVSMLMRFEKAWESL